MAREAMIQRVISCFGNDLQRIKGFRLYINSLPEGLGFIDIYLRRTYAENNRR
jgi:hypothetical protein